MKAVEIFDVTGEATKNLRREGARTFLTLIGVVIGIAAIVSLLSIGGGLSVAVNQQFESLGANTIFIIPTGFGTMRIGMDDQDVRTIEAAPGVESAVPIYSSSAVIEFNREKVSVSVMAAEAEKAAIFDNTGMFDVEEGRNFYQNESGAVLIGYNVAKELFSKEINVGKQILINGETFKVIGILEKQNTTFGGGPNTSGTLYMSLDAYRRITDDASPSIIFAKTYSTQDTDGAVDDIKESMDRKHGTDSVMVSSAESLREQANTVLGLVTIFLAGLAGISLIVGGVGIMNAMITSVIERTKEIGIMKAMGASNNKVLAIFSLEASFIGGIGGVVGTIMGFALSGVIAEVAASQGLGLTAVITPTIAIEGIFFAMIVGVISGFYPALRAARMDPVRALRYE